MNKICQLFLDEPGIYILGVLVSVSLSIFGFNYHQAMTVMFWWYITASASLGIFSMLMKIVDSGDKDIPTGYKSGNFHPSQDPTSEIAARYAMMDASYGRVNEIAFAGKKNTFIRFAQIAVTLTSFPLGAYLLKKSNNVLDGELVFGGLLIFFGLLSYRRYTR